jgi:PAS domain S-box-containing protein
MFVIDLIYNLSTLIALSIVSGFIDNRWSSKTQRGAILQGILFGIVAILGMINPLVFDVGLVFDGRSVVISLCGLFFGPIAALISGTMAIFLRIYQGGVGVYMGVSVIAASALLGTLYHYKRKKKGRQMSSLFLLGFGLQVHVIMLMLTSLLPKQQMFAVIENIGLAIITFYPLATILIGKILHDQEIKTESVNSLRKSESLFRSLAQSSPVGIWRVDKAGVVNFVNDRLIEIFGLNVDSYKGKLFTEFVLADDLDTVTQRWSQQKENQVVFDLEYRIQKVDGAPLWVHSQFQPQTNEFGDVVGYVGTIQDIDERKRTEEELRRWEMIFKSTRVGIVIGNSDSQFFDLMNPAFADMYGFTVEEMKGMHVSSVFIDDEKHRIANEIKEAFEKGFHVFESWHIRKDGSKFPVLISMTALKDNRGRPLYRIVNVQDITNIKQAEIELRNQRQRLENIIEGTNVGTWEWNVQSGEVIFNERWANIIGYNLDELKPISIDTWVKFTHPDDLEQSNATLKEHFDGKLDFYDCEARMKHKDGHWVWIQDRGRVATWDSNGKPLMMYGTHKDITEKKRWEETLVYNEKRLKEQNEEYLALNEELTEANSRLRDSEKRLKEQNEEYMALNEELTESNERIKHINKELNLARKKAEESDKLKSAFLANMSHEIRTPMNAIIGFSEILLRPNITPEKQKTFTNVLNASCNQLLTIINDVLDISKIETGQMNLLESETNLNTILRNLHSLFTPNATNKGNELRFSFDLSDDQSLVVTDETKLNQILTNLISNAVKFTDNGKIGFGYKVKGENLEFFVEDSGIGISPENHNLIFDRFRQVDMSTSRSFGGTGLGLSISKAFIEMLGGTIGVESELGKGSRFAFTIPYKPIVPFQKKTVVKDTDRYDFSGFNILLAEDEVANLMFIKELLDDTGSNLIHAYNGAKAVEEVRNNSNIHLILMDIKMPVMNGFEATGIIKNMRPDIPVIALTAYAMLGDKEKCFAAGCDGYISKPIHGTELLRLVATYLKR